MPALLLIAAVVLVVVVLVASRSPVVGASLCTDPAGPSARTADVRDARGCDRGPRSSEVFQMRGLRFFVVVLALFALPASCAPAAQRSTKRTVSVTPKSVLAGGSLTVSGRNWPRRVRVQLLIGPPYSEADPVGSVTTTAHGAFRRTLRISSAATPGRSVLLACRRSCRVKAQTSFRILAGPAGAAATRTCGHVDVPGGRAWGIRATRTTCAVGRSAARTCLRGTRPKGWGVRSQLAHRSHDAALGLAGRDVPARRRGWLHPGVSGASPGTVRA